MPFFGTTTVRFSTALPRTIAESAAAGEMEDGLRFRQGAHQDGKLPQPTDQTMKNSIAWQELERSFDYFQRGARVNRLAYLTLRTTVLFAGALVPIVALAATNDVAVACLGAVIVAAEGMTQLTQVHDHWVRYRRTAEALRREALAFVSGTGPYQHGELTEEQQLAARIVDFAGQESADWEETILSAWQKTSPRGAADPGSR
jgi:hypothetical protein